METPKKFNSKLLGPIIVAIFVLMFLNVSFLVTKHRQYSSDQEVNRKIEDIRTYVESISDNFSQDVKELAKKNNLDSWGCGPSSYALASILDKKFFGNRLTIHVIYDNEPEEILERFGFIQPENGGDSFIDHAWIEIYLKNKFLYIDPTVARYGKTKGIAFEVFEIGQPNIKRLLNEKYGVIDNRLSLMMAKIYNNIPVDEPPYQGLTIDESALPHYNKILTIRNTVSLGREPTTWKDWVDYLTNRYH